MTTLNENPEDFRQKSIMVHAFMLACYADGKMTSQAIATIESYAKSLPEFYGRNFQEYYQEAKRLAAEAEGSMDRAVNLLGEITAEALRKKTYYCLVELARSDGEITLHENKLLTAAQGSLNIDPEYARQIASCMEVKFVPAF